MNIGLCWSCCMFLNNEKEIDHKSHLIMNRTMLTSMYTSDSLKNNRFIRLISESDYTDWARYF